MPTGDNPNSHEQLKKSRLDLLPKEERRKIQALGRAAASKAKAKNKSFKELTLLILNMKADDKSIPLIQELFPKLEKSDITSRMALIAKQYEKATKYGDSKAFELLRDSSGEKPTDNLDITSMGQSMQPVFNITAVPTIIKKDNDAE